MIGTGRHEVPFGIEGVLGTVYLVIGQPERCVEWCRAQLARGHDTYTLTTAVLVSALTFAGAGEEATRRRERPDRRRRSHPQPLFVAYALYAYGSAFRDADPVRALEASRRGLVIAQDSGNRNLESQLAAGLFQLEAEHGDPLAALDHITLAIRNFYDSGNVGLIRSALATLAVFLDRRTPRTGSHHRRFRVQSPHRGDS